ncbi:MAG TPA: peptidoglycan-binding protein, partial [Roseimicrobium sp.]|nr:peptidoglycan-binding protein [Roseimicrobium sp.]
MRQYTRFKTLNARSRGGGGGSWIYGVLAIAGLALIAWIWWRSAKMHQKPPGPDATKVATTNEPPRKVAQVTNTPSTTTITNPPPAVVRMTNSVARSATNNSAPLISTSSISQDASTSFVARPVQNVLEAQIVMARAGISSGSLDGAIGSQTRAALRAFQSNNDLTITGDLDAATKSKLQLKVWPLTTYQVTTNDLARLQPLGKTWLEKSQQSAMDYETILELVAEKAHTHPGLIQRLNPGTDWTNVTAGAAFTVPNSVMPPVKSKAALIKIQLAAKTLEAFDQDGKIVAHFPCSIAQRVEKRPVGDLKVAVVAPNPNYTFNPEVFPESAEARALNRKLILHPGPNNPVGAAWIGLDRPGYGIHGTPSPEQVGRTESHG